MNTPLSSALDPRSFDLSAGIDGTRARHLQLAQWRRVHGAAAEPPPMRLMAEHPLIASASLQVELDRHVAELTAFIAARLRERPYAGVQAGTLPGPDVICADLAIVVDPASPGGWALRWVEFQAFTSILASLYTFHLGAGEIWPETRPLEAWRLPAGERDWVRAVQAWVAPDGGVLLEREPATQATRFDLQAASHLFGLPMVEPHHLVREGRGLSCLVPAGRHQEVHHIFNRLVMHELPDSAGFERTIADVAVSWHSHPAWYYGISKSWLPQLPQAAGLRCAPADTWRTLGLPAESLVAKDVTSYGGAAVLLHVDAQTLDTLPVPENWIVQPRYTPQALFAASDGQAVFGEVRCIVALPAGREPWLAGQFMRLSRGQKSSVGSLQEVPGSGLAILYRPPVL